MKDLKAARRYGREQHWRRMDAMAGEAEAEFYAAWHPAAIPRQPMPWFRRPQMTPATRLVCISTVLHCAAATTTTLTHV